MKFRLRLWRYGFMASLIILPNLSVYGHESYQHRGELQTSSELEKIRIHKKASGINTSIHEPATDPDDNPSSEPPNSYAQSHGTNSSTKIHASISAEIIATLRKNINNPAITIVPRTSQPSSPILSSFEYSFTLHNLPIEGYRVRAIKRPNGDIVILGDIPLGHYNPAQFQDLDQLIKSPEHIKDLTAEGLIRFHNNVDTNLIHITSQYKCVVTHHNQLLPSLCVTIQYNVFTYYTAKISDHKLLSIHPLGYYYCGILKNVHTKNITDQPRTFSVSLCDPNGEKNIMANKKFVFASNQPEHSSCTPPAQRQSSDSDTAKINAFLKSISQDTAPEYLWSQHADPLIPSLVLNTPGTFTYADEDQFAKRKVHLFSYLNRMLNWFESMGFEAYDTPLVIMITDKPPNESCVPMPSSASYVHYQSEATPSLQETPSGHKALHVLNFGFPRALCPTRHTPNRTVLNNISLDIDISAHELSHYVIARWIPGNTDRRYNKHNHTGAIHEGLADYFTFAATGEDCLGETVKSSACLRTASPDFKYKDKTYQKLTRGYSTPLIHEIGQLVSGMLWNIRKQVEPNQQAQFDQLVLHSLYYNPSQNVTYSDFIDALISADEDLTNGEFCSQIINSARFYRFLNKGKARKLIDQRCPKFTTSSFAAVQNSPIKLSTPQPYNISNNHALECASQNLVIEFLTGENLAESHPQSSTPTSKVSGCSSNTSLHNIAHAQPVPHTASPPSSLPTPPIQTFLIGIGISLALRWTLFS